MRYFVVADVHGHFKELKETLDKNGFDLNNPEHILISCGDLMDRGTQPRECLKFVMDLYDKKRAILIRGNHEDLIADILKKSRPDDYDFSNGTVTTIICLADMYDEIHTVGKAIENWNLLVEITHDDKLLNRYLDATINYFETEKFVFVHGWIPCLWSRFEQRYYPLENWRQEATAFDFEVSRWTSGIDAVEEKIFDKKTIICGHRPTCYWHQRFDNIINDYTPYFSKKAICLDGCTFTSKICNCLVIENEKILNY